MTVRSRALRVLAVALTGGLLLGLMAPGAGAQQVPDIDDVLNTDIELEVVSEELQDPTGLEVLDDGRVMIIERKGAVKLWHQDGTMEQIAQLEVAANDCPDCPDQELAEGGIHGLLLDPDFLDNGELYLFYSVPHSVGVAPTPPSHPDAGGTPELEGLFRLSKFHFDGQQIDLDSEEPLLEKPAYWDSCCHYSGDLEWMADGTILLSTGDDTNPWESSGYAPRDKREGREWNDADRTSQNPADRRGKVLRLNPDGSVPEDNPHVDDPDYDPYVYAMGYRNPYRISVEPRTQSVYVGPFGPGAASANPNRGPQGYVEFEIIPPGGGVNHGWPHCTGDNEPFQDYDFETGESHGPLSCEGMTPAVVWYPNSLSLRWPTLGTGANGMMAGPVYDYEGDGALQLPERLHRRVFMLEWHRDFITTAPVEDDGSLDVTVLWPMFNGEVRHPIDAEIGPDGAIYLLEYGRGFWNNNDSRLSRIICAGCTPDPADYGGADVLMPGVAQIDQALTRAGVDPRILLLVLLFGLAGGVPLARRLA